jgi:hypothetical protein
VANPLSFSRFDDQQQPGSVLLARRLLAQDTPAGTLDPGMAAVGLRKTCARVSAALRNSMGADGCNALLVRALTRVEAQHPLIADLRRASEGNISFDGLVKSVDDHGVAPVTTAIEALLTALIDILVRLIGEEMTIRITAGDAAPQSATNDGAPQS